MTVEHRPWALKSCTDPSYSTYLLLSNSDRGSVTKRIQSERSEQAVIFRAHPPASHTPPSIFLWKIDYLPVLGLHAVGTLNPVTVTCVSRACFNADLFGVCVCLWLSIIPLTLEKCCTCPTVDYCLGVFLHGAAS